MAKVTTDTITDPHFGKCAVITNGLIELRVTIDIGPRVIYCACTGMDNMFFEDTKKTPLGEKFDVFKEESDKSDKFEKPVNSVNSVNTNDQQKLYGGHRLWISPEVVPRCYHPDNLPVTVEELEDGARFTGAVEKYNQIQKSISLTLEPDAPHVKVVHTIRNVGLWDIRLAPWAITMLAPGGLEVMPMPARTTELLPNRNFTFWDYTELNDSRIYFGKDFLTLKQDTSKENPFKLGYNNEAGWAAYFNRGQVFLKYFEPTIEGFYPDNGCCFETYTNGSMIEMETLGEMYELDPDDFVTLEEEWEIYKGEGPKDPRDEGQLKAAVAEWIKI